MKILNGICVFYWVFQVVISSINVYNGKTISPVTSLTAMIICVIYFLSQFDKY